MSKMNLRGEAIAAYDAALSAPAADWRVIAEMLRAAIPTAKAKAEDAWADYQIGRYKADRPGPTCVVTFADGETARMTTATLAGKPPNVGRGLRLCIAAWQSRKQSGMLPTVAACHFERDGAIIASYEADECNAKLSAH